MLPLRGCRTGRRPPRGGPCHLAAACPFKTGPVPLLSPAIMSATGNQVKPAQVRSRCRRHVEPHEGQLSGAVRHPSVSPGKAATRQQREEAAFLNSAVRLCWFMSGVFCVSVGLKLGNWEQYLRRSPPPLTGIDWFDAQTVASSLWFRMPTGRIRHGCSSRS